MNKLVASAALGVVLTLATPLLAQAAPADTGMTADEAATTAALVERADELPLSVDVKDKTKKPGLTPMSAYGSYPTRKGVILVTSDAFKGLIPTGHAAIIYTYGSVVESLSSGVTTGTNRWNYTKNQAYGVSVSSTSATQDATAANWAYRQIGKPYNWNYLDTGTRSKFYCSQLVWASFKDNFGINLDTPSYLSAVHPMEFVGNAKTYLIWRKA